MPTRLLLTCLLVAACGEPFEPAVASTSQAVVGGQAEARYPPVGYLLVGDSRATLHGPNCGATLIAPDVAVTAAHCIAGEKAFGVAIGPSALRVNAKTAVPHASYLGNAGGMERYAHDVAVVFLDVPIPSVEPATVGAASTAGAYRYIGYGRTTVGDSTVTAGYTNERKSTAMAVTSVVPLNLFTAGLGGGLCWGDSGGPLMDEDGGTTIYGVLADFSEVFVCKVGNEMIFTSLDAERPFLSAALACHERATAGCIAAVLKGGALTPDGGLACETFCAEVNLGNGGCGGGWRCDGLCATPATCLESTAEARFRADPGGCSSIGAPGLLSLLIFLAPLAFGRGRSRQRN